MIKKQDLEKEKKIDNFKNPFREINAVNLLDRDILKYWISPRGFLEDGRIANIEFADHMPNILFGGRGSGKTTLLRYLSFDIQKMKFFEENDTENLSEFLSNNKFLGLYYRFDAPKLKSFRGRGQTDEVWIILFGQFFELIIGQKYLKMLEDLFQKNAISSVTEEEVCEDICLEIFGQNRPELRSIKKIREKLKSSQRRIETWKENITFHKLKFPEMLFPENTILFDLPELCNEKISEIRDKMIFLLLDEYENLNLEQQKKINALMKHARFPVSLKIGTRNKGVKTYETVNETEYLREGSDYRAIKLEYVTEKNDANFKSLVLDIVNKRLQEHEYLCGIPNVSIETFLGNSLTTEEEALRLVKKSKDKQRHFDDLCKLFNTDVDSPKFRKYVELISCPQNPLIEKLNMVLLWRKYRIEQVHEMMNRFIKEKNSDKQYANLYEKNKVALLFQLYGDYAPNVKRYYGLDMYLKLSSGIIRTFVELCYYAFNEAIFNDLDSLMDGKKIDEDSQNAAVQKKIKNMVADMKKIPKDKGLKIYGFVETIGTIFKTLHKDKRIKEPEPTYFSTIYPDLAERTRELIDTAVMWSFLDETTSMAPKSATEQHYEDYTLNRILSPRYTISYRKRGRTVIPPPYVDILAFGEKQQKNDIIRKITRSEPSDTMPPTLTEFL